MSKQEYIQPIINPTNKCIITIFKDSSAAFDSILLSPFL